MISSTDLPCENARIADEVPNRTSIPSAPVSIAIRASSRWQRTWVSTLARSGSAATVLRSASDWGEAQGEVSSRYSTPNSSSISAIAIFCDGVKWAGANCSPSRSVDSMMLNALMVMAPPKNKKPSSTGTRGLLSWYHPTLPSSRENGLFESAAVRPEDSSLITGAIRLGLLRIAPVRPAAPRPFSAVPWILLLSCQRLSVIPASAYSPSSTPFRMNLLAGTIRAIRVRCQAAIALCHRLPCADLLDVVDHVVGDRNSGRVHEAMEFGRVVELIDHQAILVLQQVHRKKSAADRGSRLLAQLVDLGRDLAD